MATKTTIKCVLLSSLATLPTKAYSDGGEESDGYDLYSPVEQWVWPWSRSIIPLGIKIMMPEGTYGRIAPRSGLAAKHSIDVGAGVIDGNYRGMVKVLLINSSWWPFKVTVGMRVAQLMEERIGRSKMELVNSLPESNRGENGIGSSGTH